MVSLDSVKQMDFQYQWIAIVVTIATTVCMVSGLVYCMCLSWLMKGTSPSQAMNLRSLKLSSGTQQQQKNKKTMAAAQAGSAAKSATVEKSDAAHTSSKRKRKKSPAKMKLLGCLQLHFAYFPSRACLKVTVVCAQGLPSMDISGTSDPYCKLLLLPAQDKKVSTKVKSCTLNPVWNETLKFDVAPGAIAEQTLYAYVLDHDALNADDMIGECRFNLCNLDIARGQTVMRDLMTSSGYASHLGEILLALKYSPSHEQLTINVLKCTNLKAMDSNNFSDPYVKLFHWKDGKKYGKKKTKTVIKNRNPIYNETFTFEITLAQIHSSQILVEVMDYDKMSANDLIGVMLLGDGCHGTGAVHWNDMCKRMDHSVAEWHRLQAQIAK